MNIIGISTQLAYELIPTTDQQIKLLDEELQDLYV
jgi:hypothetical protein